LAHIEVEKGTVVKLDGGVDESAAVVARPSDQISDLNFIEDLGRLKDLRSFLIREVVISEDARADLTFGSLNLLSYSRDGRPPTEQEWAQVEKLTQALFGLLTGPLRRRYIVGGIPTWVSLVPIVFAAVGVTALVLAVLSGPGAVQILPFYIVWLVCLGAVGSIAFIAMNALSVQDDATFDLTNDRLMILRIVLGGLFALVITLPLGFEGFVTFVENITSGTGRGSDSIVSEAPLLLLPFVLGFSTTLVILILNRLVEAVQSFFGRGSGSNGQPGVKPPGDASPGAMRQERSPVTQSAAVP
jgi:hypothetical protein